MDQMSGLGELHSGEIVKTFHSSKPSSRFGEATERVGDVSAQAQRGQLSNAYDPEKAYQLAVVSGWAYADGQTLADKIRHYGFGQGSYVQQFSVVNDAMLVVARAYLIRSEDGRTGILAFRGTEPVNAINWLTNADTTARDFYGRGKVHHGFHANVEALWSYCEAAIMDAVQGKPPPRPGNGEGAGGQPQMRAMEHLYITGHSLGGAMAVLTAAKVFCDDKYAAWRPLIRGIYTFGQPQVGDADFARSCGSFAQLLYRHEYRHDVVPVLPPMSVARFFGHFGENRVSGSQDEPWRPSETPTRPLRFIVQALACVSASFFTRRLLLLRRLDGLWYSIDDHFPQRYIDTCKSSLPSVKQKAAASSTGPVERVKRMARTVADVGKHVLVKSRPSPPAAAPPAR